MTLELAYTEMGKGPPLVILHGLFGSSRNWTSVARRLGETHRVFAVDLRNHGASPWAETMDYGEMAEDVRAERSELLCQVSNGRSIVIRSFVVSLVERQLAETHRRPRVAVVSCVVPRITSRTRTRFPFL